MFLLWIWRQEVRAPQWLLTRSMFSLAVSSDARGNRSSAAEKHPVKQKHTHILKCRPDRNQLVSHTQFKNELSKTQLRLTCLFLYSISCGRPKVATTATPPRMAVRFRAFLNAMAGPLVWVRGKKSSEEQRGAVTSREEQFSKPVKKVAVPNAATGAPASVGGTPEDSTCWSSSRSWLSFKTCLTESETLFLLSPFFLFF